MSRAGRTFGLLLVTALLVWGIGGCRAAAEPEAALEAGRSITDRRVVWPSWETWQRVILMGDYNTRVVVIGTTLLGLAAGTIGSFTLLRKRALMGDALSHATLPGIGLAFMLASSLGYDGKTLPILLVGAAVTGILGMGAILLIRNLTRLKEDAALGIVLSVFFGGGVALLGVVQQMAEGHAAGLESFIYGKTASMVASDAWLIGTAGGGSAVLTVLLFKELKLLCFDEAFAGSMGFPVVLLDLVLMGVVVVVTIIGLQAVGLILMIALLVIPAAAARFWTERMTRMAAVAAGIGAVSCMIGSGLSAVFPRLPSGAMIVLVSALIFLTSMIVGPRRGVLVRALRRHSLNQRIDRQHLLRAIYEVLEARGEAPSVAAVEAPVAEQKRALGRESERHGGLEAGVPIAELLTRRSWSAARLRRAIRRASRDALVAEADGSVRLTPRGTERAASVVRDHRLWEIYLITHADIAPSRVDRDADAIEHVLDSAMIAELQTLLEDGQWRGGVPASPHEFVASGTAADGAGSDTAANPDSSKRES